MKKIALILFCIISTKAISQNFSYGVVLGFNAHSTSAEEPLIDGGAITPFNLGVYGDYQISDGFGLMINGLIGKTIDQGRYGLSGIGKLTHTSINFQFLGKFDLDKNYNKGKYLFAGPRLSLVSDVKIRRTEERIDYIFDSTNYGINFGFGGRFAKHFMVELTVDIGISNKLKSEVLKARNIGGMINFKMDLKSLLSN